jgi:guanylate kinase
VNQAIILYGPPAAGKDTITRELELLGHGHTHFQRLKVGNGRVSGYRQITEPDLRKMREHGDILYKNSRYGATYAIDRPHLDAITENGHTPVVHIGQTAGILALLQRYPANWLVIGLWCSKDEATRRLDRRSDTRRTERLAAWDATLADLRSTDPALFTLTLNTSVIDAGHAARIIDTCCQSRRQSVPSRLML